jgi:hypothetical protein
MCESESGDEEFNPRDYVVKPSVVSRKDNIFEFAPSECDACAFWLSSGFRGLCHGWIEFVRDLSNPPHQVRQLVCDQWQPFALEDGNPAWKKFSGRLLWIDPAIGIRLKYVYLFPNMDDGTLDDPEKARCMVMEALETLNDARAKNIAMNSIQGPDRHVRKSIKNVMFKAASDWFTMDDNLCRSKRTIDQIYLVDLEGDFGPSAFSHAMMQALEHPEANTGFQLKLNGGSAIEYPCKEFLEISAPQQNILRPYLDRNARLKVLDIGCCVGRHLRYIRYICTEADLWATEKDGTLMAYCRDHFTKKVFETWDDIKERNFHAILLLGNGLGIFGRQSAVENGLRRAFNSLIPGGVLIGEGKSLDNRDCSEDEIQISYRYIGIDDHPFQWFHCTSQYVTELLTRIGFINVEIEPMPTMPGGYLFLAEKPQE